MKLIRVCRASVVVLLLSAFTAAYGQANSKVWRFESVKGPVTFSLFVFPPRIPGISLTIEPAKGSAPSNEVLTRLLGNALRDLPAQGHDPSELRQISIYSQNSVYREGLEKAVRDSGDWKHCLHTKYCRYAQPVANAYLAKVHAYGAFDQVLSGYGLRVHSVTIDDMGCGWVHQDFRCSGVLDIVIK